MDWMHLGLSIINSIIVSIPEETFIVCFALFVLGKSEFIKLKTANLPRFIACVVPSAFIPNLLREFLPQTREYLMPVGILVIFILIVSIYRLSIAKDILRAFIGTSLGIIIAMVFQMAYAPLVAFGTGISVDAINKSPLLLFFWTLPERAMEFSFLILLLARKGMASRVNILSILAKNRRVAFITLFLLVFNVTFLVIMAKLICYDNILNGTSLTNIVLIIALVIIFPVMNISLLLVVIYSVYYRYSIRLLLSKDRINTLVSVLAVYTEEQNYSKIDSLVADLHNQVNIL